MTLRLLYLIVIRVFGWLALLGRGQAFKAFAAVGRCEAAPRLCHRSCRTGPRLGAPGGVLGHGCSAWRPGIAVCARGTAGMIIPSWAIFVPNWGNKCSKTSRDGRI